MASARKQKDTAVPTQPTRGRIHIFTVCTVCSQYSDEIGGST